MKLVSLFFFFSLCYNDCCLDYILLFLECSLKDRNTIPWIYRTPRGGICSAQPQQRTRERWVQNLVTTLGTSVYELVVSVGSASHPRIQNSLCHMRLLRELRSFWLIIQLFGKGWAWGWGLRSDKGFPAWTNPKTLWGRSQSPSDMG